MTRISVKLQVPGVPWLFYFTQFQHPTWWKNKLFPLDVLYSISRIPAHSPCPDHAADAARVLQSSSAFWNDQT